MRKIAVLCLVSLFLSACSSDSGDLTDSNRSEATDGSNSEEESKGEADSKKAAEAEAERIAKESTSALSDLTADLETKVAEWQTQFEAATDPKDKNELLSTRPQIKFAEQMVELAKKYPGTAAATSAWNLAVKNGAGETKASASATVLEAAKKLKDELELEKQLKFVMAEGSGSARDEAMGLLFVKATKAIESPESYELLKQIVKTPVGNVAKSNAIKQLKKFAEADKKSEKACECMELIYRHGPVSSRNLILQDLLDFHINHDRMIGITSELSERVSKPNEHLLLEICEEASGKAQANAMITLSKFYANRKEAAAGVAVLNEEELKQLKPEQVEYLQTKHDMGPVNELATKLTTYIEDHTPLVESAKTELKSLQSLTAEPEAAEAAEPEAAEPEAAEPEAAEPEAAEPEAAEPEAAEPEAAEPEAAGSEAPAIIE